MRGWEERRVRGCLKGELSHRFSASTDLLFWAVLAHVEISSAHSRPEAGMSFSTYKNTDARKTGERKDVREGGREGGRGGEGERGGGGI